MQIRFDEETLAKLRPAERAVTYWDTGMPGLVVKVSPSETRSFTP